MKDDQLIEEVLSGNPAAERELYDRYVDRVYGLACRMSGDPVLAEDFTQDAFIRVFDKLAGFRGESSFSTWLYRVATNVIINGLRKMNLRRQREHGMDDVLPMFPSRQELDPAVARGMKTAIDELPEILRTTLILHEVEGFRHQEISEILEIPEGTSRARLARAKGLLRDALDATNPAGAARNET